MRMDKKQKERLGCLILRYGFSCMQIGNCKFASPQQRVFVTQADKRLDEIKKILGVKSLG